MLKKLFLLFALLVLLVIGAGIDVYRQLDRPLQLDQPLTIEFQPGESLRSLLDELGDKQVMDSLRQRYYAELFARLTGQAAQLKAGEYVLQPGTDTFGLLHMLYAGQVKQYSFTIVEGWTFAEMLTQLKQQKALKQDLPATPADIMQALGEGQRKAEGLFFPDTYYFPRGMSALSFLQRAYSRMQEILHQQWQQRGSDLPYKNAYQALIMASIVERETGSPDERAEIAGVFVRRLHKGMLLQTDPTVIYGMGDKYAGNITKQDLLTDTPYNTYTRAGLPPTPIALPGKAAIHAALHPAAGSALYFVARGDGTHQFSDTLAQHQQAVRKYQLHQGAP